jgi:hypothetical protein
MDVSNSIVGNKNENDDVLNIVDSAVDNKDSSTYIQSHTGYFAVMLSLRVQLNQAKQWVTRLNTLTQTDPTALAARSEAMVAETGRMCVDLSEYVQIFQPTSDCYCLCRMGSHGEMIGCDLCGEWYHYGCVGMSQSQATKVEKYVCLRCTILLSFQEAARQVAAITNKWMRPMEVVKQREINKNKVLYVYRYTES